MNYYKYIVSLTLIIMTIGAQAQTTTVSGKIITRDGEPMENVTVTITTDDQNLTATTDGQGDYRIENVPIDGNLSIEPTSDLNPLNGVSTFDVVLASKHILGLAPFESAVEYIAMDVNQSGSITAIDIVWLRNLILGLITEIPNVASWRFIEENQLAAINFDQSQLPEYDTSFPGLDLTPNAEGVTLINFIGIKVGDANGNATTGF